MIAAIYGYGNLGKGVELALKNYTDFELFGVFTRRNPNDVKTVTGVKTYAAKDVFKYEKDIDVMFVCGGSATDLPKITPVLAEKFNVIDSFDTHAKIPEHFDRVDKAARRGNKIALISCGWDPGLFSLGRLYSEAVTGNGKSYTFWGKGVSQGHSDAIRRIDGVTFAKEYTVPVETAVNAVKTGENPKLTERETHKRECFVVAGRGADREKIEKEIKTMPYYFDGYETTVNFVTEEELKTRYGGYPHGGKVLCAGRTGENLENKQIMELSLKLDSNPEFTGSVLTAYARGMLKAYEKGVRGAVTVFDIPPAYLSPLSGEELRKKYL